jgi:hypothetical protein
MSAVLPCGVAVPLAHCSHPRQTHLPCPLLGSSNPCLSPVTCHLSTCQSQLPLHLYSNMSSLKSATQSQALFQLLCFETMASLLSHPHKPRGHSHSHAPQEASVYIGLKHEGDGSARTRNNTQKPKHITWLRNPPCRSIAYHLTCGMFFFSRHSEYNLFHPGRSWSIPFYVLTSVCTKLRSLRQVMRGLAGSPRQTGMKAALLARGHLCCLSLLGKNGKMDCGVLQSSCCCGGSHPRVRLVLVRMRLVRPSACISTASSSLYSS